MAEYPALMLWTDAYLADTTHLSAEEHGVYLLLLMAAWRTPDCSLPDDDDRLARMARVGLKKWRSVRIVMEGFWTIGDGKWTQKRLLKERGRIVDRRLQQSEAGKQSAKNRFPAASTGNDITPSQERPAGKANTLENKETPSTDVQTKDPTKGQQPQPIPIPSKNLSTSCERVGGALRARGASRVDFGNPENRQAYARQKIGPAIGWDTMMAAEDPSNPKHAHAVLLAKAEARKQRVTWHPPKAA